MKFVSFSVENYRSIRKRCEFGVSLLTTIIGPNNEGKSNILRSIVTALRTLSLFANREFAIRRGLIRKDGNALSYRTFPGGGRIDYDWTRDYPLSGQRRKNKTGKAKRSRFVLGFELDTYELNEMCRVTDSSFQNPNVAVRLEYDRDKIYFNMNLKGVFNKTASLEKMMLVADFISSRIDICYIDAVRTSETAAESISRLVDMQINNKLYESDEYRKWMEKISAKKDEIMAELSTQVGASLKEFLPSIKSAQIKAAERNRWAGKALEPLVSVNDGELTQLSQKGSGVQSLIAIALARFASQHKAKNRASFVLAIEEPESHLHPDAVHRVRNLLRNIASRTPVIITSHSPLMVNAEDIGSNIVVSQHAAHPSKNIGEIRKVLGVHISDSLSIAENVVLVEGASDQRILEKAYSIYYRDAGCALRNGALKFLPAGGCSKISPLAKIAHAAVCNVYVVLDDDVDGRNERDKLVDGNLFQVSEVSCLKCKGMKNSEIEDFINRHLYWDSLRNKYNLHGDNIDKIMNDTSKKWSARLCDVFSVNSIAFDSKTEDDCKRMVADSVVECDNIDSMLVPYRKDVIIALMQKIKAMTSHSAS